MLSILMMGGAGVLNGDKERPSGAENPKRQPGVALTFDDKYVDEWMKMDSIFGETSHWNLTFFVSAFAKTTASQRSALVALQSKGHEIAFHGDAHVSALPFIKANSLEKYLATDFTQLEPMRSLGLNIHSFAYPSGTRDASTDSALLQRFSILRGVTNKDAAEQTHSCFFNGNRVVDAIGIEFQYKYFSHAYLESLLQYAKDHNTVVVLYGHRPMPVADRTKHEVDYSTIQFICDFVKSNGMKFYTMGELASF